MFFHAIIVLELVPVIEVVDELVEVGVFKEIRQLARVLVIVEVNPAVMHRVAIVGV